MNRSPQSVEWGIWYRLSKAKHGVTNQQSKDMNKAEECPSVLDAPAADTCVGAQPDRGEHQSKGQQRAEHRRRHTEDL